MRGLPQPSISAAPIVTMPSAHQRRGDAYRLKSGSRSSFLPNCKRPCSLKTDTTTGAVRRPIATVHDPRPPGWGRRMEAHLLATTSASNIGLAPHASVEADTGYV